MNETVLFDPGIGQYVLNFNDFINDVYSQLMRLNSISQKRTKFKLLNDKIYKGIENNISFYLGCLLWAYYIKKENEKSSKEISGNVFLTMTKEQIEDYDFLIQVDFLENYFDSYERDTLYYTGKSIKIPDNWKYILNLYREFLELNKGFVSTKTTDDLKLPKELYSKSINENILELIQNVVKSGNLYELLKIEL